eukprot:jgi/Botrbrau1/1314/Bobra.0063s0030.1
MCAHAIRHDVRAGRGGGMHRTLPEAHKGGGAPPLETLRVRGSALAVRILQECWGECVTHGGRDIIRALLEVSKMPEFKDVWRHLLAGRKPSGEGGVDDMSGRSGGAGPVATPLEAILSHRTSRDVLLSRLTPEMEQHIYFLLKQVRMGKQKRYENWFKVKHLSGGNAGTLVAELLRYICGVYHPHAHIQASDVLKRWAVAGWLLRLPGTYVAQSNQRLALFFDWFFFKPKTDSFMNLEPAILLMVHSIPHHASVTNQLLEFLFFTMESLWPQRKQLVHDGVKASVAKLCEIGVVRSLEPLVSAQELNPGLRGELRRFFPAFCGPPAMPSVEAVGSPSGTARPQIKPIKLKIVPRRPATAPAAQHLTPTPPPPAKPEAEAPSPSSRPPVPKEQIEGSEGASIRRPDRCRSPSTAHGSKSAAPDGDRRPSPKPGETRKQPIDGTDPGASPVPRPGRKRPAEGPAPGPAPKRPMAQRDIDSPTSSASSSTPTKETEEVEVDAMQTWKVSMKASMDALTEACNQAKLDELEPAMSRVVTSLVKGEKAHSKQEGSQKGVLDMNDLEREWGALRATLAGVLEVVRMLDTSNKALPDTASEAAQWLPEMGGPFLEETVGGALLLVCAESGQGTAEGTAAVRLAGALRCCDLTATLGAHLLRHACLLANAQQQRPAGRADTDGKKSDADGGAAGSGANQRGGGGGGSGP